MTITKLRIHIAPVGFEIDRIVLPAREMRADKDVRKARPEAKLEELEREMGEPMAILACERLIHQISLDKWNLLGDAQLVIRVREISEIISRNRSAWNRRSGSNMTQNLEPTTRDAPPFFDL